MHTPKMVSIYEKNNEQTFLPIKNVKSATFIYVRMYNAYPNIPHTIPNKICDRLASNVKYLSHTIRDLFTSIGWKSDD